MRCFPLHIPLRLPEISEAECQKGLHFRQLGHHSLSNFRDPPVYGSEDCCTSTLPLLVHLHLRNCFSILLRRSSIIALADSSPTSPRETGGSADALPVNIFTSRSSLKFRTSMAECSYFSSVDICKKKKERRKRF